MRAKQAFQAHKDISKTIASNEEIEGMGIEEIEKWASKIRKLAKHRGKYDLEYFQKQSARQRFEKFFDDMSQDIKENLKRNKGSVSACLKRYIEDPDDWEYTPKHAMEAEVVDWRKERADYLNECWDSILKGNDYY